MSYFKKHVDLLRNKKLYPVIHHISGPSCEPEIVIDGSKYLTFSSNNYLGLAGNDEVKREVARAIEQYGVGTGSTRLLSGTLDVQVEFEKELAEFMGFGGSLTFSSGYLANIGVIRMLVDQFPYYKFFDSGEGVIISDQLNHASVIDGIRLAKAERVVYKHNDMDDLAKSLEKYKDKRKLVITDGVFSMDGELANLVEITKLTKEFGALLFVDDSHAVGVLGDHGQGTAHKLGIEKKVDVIMGSFTKAFGSIGGFVTADSDTIDYLRVTARGFIFSDPIIPAIVAGLRRTLELVKNGDSRRKKALENSEYLRRGLRSLGFQVLGNGTPIVPLVLRSEPEAISFYQKLLENMILAPCIRQPAVPPGTERIRFSVMASHEKAHIDRLLNICSEIGRNLHVANAG